MRRTLTLVIVPLLVFGCTSGGDVLDVEGTGTLKATVDGQPWTASSIQATFLGNVLTIVGDNGSITIALAATTNGTGSYDLSAGSANGTVTEGGSQWFAVGLGGSGTMTITSLSSNHAAGTFVMTGGPIAGTAVGTRSVTGGTFDVKY
jgi:Family of unknown function (DUF6252)